MKKTSLIILALALSGCGVVGEQAEPKVSLKDSCVLIAKEFQTFFQSSSSFQDSTNALALGLSIASADAEPELAQNLDVYVELMRKVDSSVKTNDDFQALVEQRHVDARDKVFSICAGEGIKID